MKRGSVVRIRSTDHSCNGYLGVLVWKVNHQRHHLPELWAVELLDLPGQVRVAAYTTELVPASLPRKIKKP